MASASSRQTGNIKVGATQGRPALQHAATTQATAGSSAQNMAVVPQNSSSTAEQASAQAATRPVAPRRPSFLRSVTDSVVNLFTVKPDLEREERVAATTPTHWSNKTHYQSLVQSWDNIQPSRVHYTSEEVNGNLNRLFRWMIRTFPKLNEGDVVLSIEFMRYMLQDGKRFDGDWPKRMSHHEFAALGGHWNNFGQ